MKTPIAGSQPADIPAAGPVCRYPGCGSPARSRAGDGPGAPPRYCGQAVAEDRGRDGTAEVIHSALTAFRRRQELAGQAPGSSDGGRPVTAAITRAGAIRDDTIAAVTTLAGQLETVLGQLAGISTQLAAATPEAAEAQAETARTQAAADTAAARAELARQAAITSAARQDEAEARAAADQAITAMNDARAARQAAGTQAAAHQAAAVQARDQAAQDAAGAAAAILTAQQQAQQIRDDAQAAITAARAERDTALAAAAAATARADQALAQATAIREDHARHHAELAAAHQQQLDTLTTTITDLRQHLEQARTAADAERSQRQH
ncbi:MAG: hypothetical protein ACRDN1_15035, partial [Trebonia sp.]